MISKRQILALIFSMGLMPAIFAQGSVMKALALRCEYRDLPAGIDVLNPRLSWALTSAENGQHQTAYRIVVASSPQILSENRGDLWDSRKIFSDQTLHIRYAGKTLLSGMKVWWKVQVWDRNGMASSWSDPGSWSMGLLKETDWEAQWIADPSAVHNAKQTLYGFLSEFNDEATSDKSVTINFRQRPQFDAVRLFPACPEDTISFLFPVRFRIETANRPDFSDAILLVDKTDIDFTQQGTEPITFHFPPVHKRFIRLTATRLAPFEQDKYAFALAEMEVLSNGKNIAYEDAVFSRGSREDGSWATVNLTDGITRTVHPPHALPATHVRKAFSVSGPVRKATAYVTALGLYEFRINGQRIGEQLLSPEWTNYSKRVSYQTYDVTKHLKQGKNAAAALLGEGWYAGRLMWVGRFPYGNFPKFLLQIEVEMKDGSRKTIISDNTWRTTSKGPIRASGIYDGETYDARLEQSGWDEPGFDDRHWAPARAYNLDARRLVWLRNEPILVEKELTPVVITEPSPGIYLFDFGQNMVGWCRIRAEGSKGRTVHIRHGEAVDEKGMIYTDNLRSALQTDSYTPGENGSFEYEPRFTYHGFRYVEVSGLAQPPSSETVTGCVFHSSSPFVSSFACSDPDLDKLMENIRWTQRGNLMSSPNDCPQRDERMGWLGDIQAFAQTAAYNMDMAAFFTKFLQDTRDDQAHDGRFPAYAPFPGEENKPSTGAPAWSDAGVFVPWTAYVNYADTSLIREHFSAACRWVNYVYRHNPDLIWKNGRNHDYNDWLNGDRVLAKDWPKRGGEVPREVFATAFFAQSVHLVARMAEILNRADDAVYYGLLADQIRNAFNDQFVQPDGTILGNTQGGYALALHFNLLPDPLRPKASKHMAENIQKRYNGHLSTGIQTSHRAMLELSRNGYDQLAWQLITDRTFPSWIYMIDNGATTIWERWDGYVEGRGFQDPGMNSFNHWALGAVGEWMWKNMIGLHPDELSPGWKHFTIAPQPGGGVSWARGEFQSIRGRISSSWTMNEGKFTLDVTIPPNTTATVKIPANEKDRFHKNGDQVFPDSIEKGSAIFRTGPGVHQFVRSTTR